MPWFIKTEQFTSETKKLLPKMRRKYLEQHYSWVCKLNDSGITISSGYLVDKDHSPGGGGLLIIKADSYKIAKSIIEKDPMIISGLVTWNLQEWVPILGEPITGLQRG